jgi:hypothetical protein
VLRATTRALLFLTVGVLVCARTARADDASCIAAHVEAQRLQKAGKVRSARDSLVTCANPSCPAMLVGECSSMLAEVDKSVPTIVLEAQDSNGRDLGDVRVSIGGQLLTPRLDGKAIELDPGEHTFRFETPGFAALEQTVIVREGDKNRRIGVVFSAGPVSPPPVDPDGDRDISPAFWASGAVGVAGLVLFGALGLTGLQQRSDLDEQGCAPNCDPDDVDQTRALFIGADVSLAIGIAGLALTPVFYFTSPMKPASKSGGVTLHFGVGGTAATFGGAF